MEEIKNTDKNIQSRNSSAGENLIILIDTKTIERKANKDPLQNNDDKNLEIFSLFESPSTKRFSINTILMRVINDTTIPGNDNQFIFLLLILNFFYLLYHFLIDRIITSKIKKLMKSFISLTFILYPATSGAGSGLVFLFGLARRRLLSRMVLRSLRSLAKWAFSG